MKAAINDIAPPELFGPENAAVTLVGWGSTDGVIREAIEKLAGEEGIVANQLADQMDRAVPRRGDQPPPRAEQAVIIVENNYSGQFARYLRSRDELRGRRPHSQVRRRAVHAASHRRSGKGGSGRKDQTVRARPRGSGVDGEKLRTERRNLNPAPEPEHKSAPEQLATSARPVTVKDTEGDASIPTGARAAATSACWPR